MSQVKPVPEGRHTVQPYLILANCVEAISFYQRSFEATELCRIAATQGSITHAEIRIGDSVVMMADEHTQMDAYSPAHYGGSPVSLMIYVEDCDAIYRRALDNGAKSIREPADQPHGDRMAGICDPFGYKWFIATRIR